MLAERKLDAMKHAPQSRAGGLAGTLGPQQRGNDVPCNGALGLREIDQQRKTLAQVQFDRAVVAVDRREPERLKREPSHESIHCPVGVPRGTRRGRSSDNSQARSSPRAIERFGLLHSAPLPPAQYEKTFMFARLLILFYATLSYAVFLVSFLCAVGFVGNY